MSKFFAAIFIVIAAICLFPIRVYAADNFLTAYDVTYTVMENGITHTSFKISLTNKLSNSYASSYKIQIGFKDVKNVQASDPEGILSPIIEKSENGNVIDLTFRKRVVGIGNTLTFNISFDTSDVVQKQGKVWEVNIPGIENQNDFSSFNVHLKTPPSLGLPSYIKPTQSSDGLDFTKEQLKSGGISVGFGNEQIYKFTLTYHLKNTHMFPIKTEIALPPTTNYQDVIIDSISPRPANVNVDEDGNWLAQYSLKPSQKVDIKVIGKARLLLYPRKQKETDEKLLQYLKEKQYWQIQNPEIKKIASTLKTPYAIYQYVVNTLKYDYSRVTDGKPRLGALQSLKNPSSAVCLEFTDLFVTLARAAGIPAREVNGFAYTLNDTQRPLSLVKDILHAWPQYYDKELQTWIMVDPTWGNTTQGIDYFSILDFDHFAFVIKGMDSNYPVPAGGYKSADTINIKDVYVSFDEVLDNAQPSVVSTVFLPQSVMAGFPLNGYLFMQNNGSSLFPSQSISVEDSLFKTSQQNILSSQIPPFGYTKIPLSFRNVSFLTNGESKVTIRVGKETITHKIRVIPFFLTTWAIIGGVTIASITIIIYFITRYTRNISVSRQTGTSSLRGKS